MGRHSIKVKITLLLTVVKKQKQEANISLNSKG